MQKNIHLDNTTTDPVIANFNPFLLKELAEVYLEGD